jgi:hypothetical protein
VDEAPLDEGPELSAVPAEPGRHPVDAAPEPDEPDRPRRRGEGLLSPVAIAWAALVAVLLLASAGLGANRPEATAAPSTSVGAAGAASRAPGVAEDFDALPIDATPAPPWQIGGAAKAGVIALPTSVERSLRLTTSSKGEATTACRPTATTGQAASTSVELVLLVGMTADHSVPVITFRDGDRTVAAAGVDPSGRIVDVGGGMSPVAITGDLAVPEGQLTSQAWRQVVVSVDAATTAVCLSSPQGRAGGWIAIDRIALG